MHQGLLARGAVSVLAAVVLVGCGDPLGSDPLAERQAVRGGEPTGDSHAGVLYVSAEIRNVGGQQVFKIGSSALVAPNLIATALHVVSQNPSNVPFTCDSNGYAVTGSSGASLGATVAPEKVSVYAGPTPTGEPLAQGVSIVSTGSTTICQNDLAFVILDRPLDLPTYPVRRRAPAEVGEVMTVVGYGTGLNTAPEKAVRSEREVSVAAVGQWIRTFTVSIGPCEGDSGGPALTESGEVAGIFSSVALDCTASGATPKYTDLSYFEPLVEHAFEEANAGSPWPAMGEGGAGGQPARGEAGMPSTAGAPTEPTKPTELADAAGGGCALATPQRSPSAVLAMLLAGVALCRRVSRREQT